jgi:hypothetical protein
MRDLGVRIARQKLLRYRVPEADGARWRRWVLLAAAAWTLWALFLSDHSVTRLLKLKSDRDRLSGQLARAQAELQRTQSHALTGKLTPSEQERILRERHGYAKDGEWIYILGDDSTRLKMR